MIFRELRIWSSLRHPNVILLLGYIMHDKYPAFVSQWMFEGTLRKYVDNNPDVSIITMAGGVAEGYLQPSG